MQENDKPLLDALRDIVSYTSLYGEAAGQRASKALEEYLDIGQGEIPEKLRDPNAVLHRIKNRELAKLNAAIAGLERWMIFKKT